MLGAEASALMQGGLRFVVVDGSTVQGPGASGTWYRLHIAVDLVKLHLIHVEVTDKHQGEHLGYYPLQAGDVVLIDRAYNQAKGLIEKADEGVSVVLRYNPHSLNVYDATGMKIDWYEELKTTQDIERCVPVRVHAEGEYIEGYVHACRLPPAQAAKARRRARVKAKKKGRSVQRRTLVLAEWVLIFTTLPPALLPTATLAALYRVRWQVGVPSEGHRVQSVKVRPRPRDSSLVAWEAPWRESKTVKPSDNVRTLAYSNLPGCNVQ